MQHDDAARWPGALRARILITIPDIPPAVPEPPSEGSLPLTTPSARLTSALADRYRLEREIGQGGMATVYLAEDLKHGRRVAIKVLHPELSAVLGGERFLGEIKVTANLQHPHILGLIDSGEADGLLYYVMPYVTGESLRARLQRERQLPVEDALRIAREVASALDYAHRQGVVHRDIKPENILLQDGAALVADFGIALAVHQAGGNRMTQTGMSLGTPAYMSPEQAMGEREIGPRSDVYALGAMAYEMLAGEPPFTGPNSQAIVAKVLTEQPPAAPSQAADGIPGVEAAILTALQKLPADRWGSAKEFGDALAGAPTQRSGSVPTVVLPAAGAGAQRRRGAGVVGLGGLDHRGRGLGAGGLGAAPPAPRAATLEARHPRSRARRQRRQQLAAAPQHACPTAQGVVYAVVSAEGVSAAGAPVAGRGDGDPDPGSDRVRQSAGVAGRALGRRQPGA